MVLCDTDVFIELFKGNKDVYERIKSIGISEICLSSITVMELYYGALNKKELAKIKTFLSSFEIVQLERKISEKSIELIENYAKSHNLEIPDSLIASTAMINDLRLFTYNRKDFKYIVGLVIIN